jgi:hypothetical protein
VIVVRVPALSIERVSCFFGAGAIALAEVSISDQRLVTVGPARLERDDTARSFDDADVRIL